jgi:hypothetical protein
LLDRLERLEHQDSREFVEQMVSLDSLDLLVNLDSKDCVVIQDLQVQLAQLGHLDHKAVLVRLATLELLAHVEILGLQDLLDMSDNLVLLDNGDHRDQLDSRDLLEQLDNLETRAQLVLRVPKVTLVHRDFLELQAVPVPRAYQDSKDCKDYEVISVQVDSLALLGSEVQQELLASLAHKDRKAMLEPLGRMVLLAQAVHRGQQVTRVAKEMLAVLACKGPLVSWA